jgi:acetyl-CoA synthetase/medium-chain acyl-CoA synthetase
MENVPEFFNFSSDVMDKWARIQPDVVGLWCVDTAAGREYKYTFKDIAALSRQCANFLKAQGIGRGDRVLLMLPRVPQWWFAMLGLIRLGAVPVPGTLLLTRSDVIYRWQSAKVKAIITNAEGAGKIGDYNGLRVMVGPPISGWIDFDAGLSSASPKHEAEPTRADEPGIIYVTSATTGSPKLVVHSQISYGLGHRLTGELLLGCQPGDLHWNISDLGWGKAAWSSFYGPWQMGACIFAYETHAKFDPATTLNVLANYPIATWCAPTTALRMIIRQDLSGWKFPRLRRCVTAGEPLNPEVLKIWHAATGLMLHEGYGQTETVVLIGNFKDNPIHPGSMGRAAPGMDIQILDSDLKPLPDGREGEIALRVKPRRPVGLFMEYKDAEEQMKKSFQGDWYLTGDRAVRDSEGYFWFIGRKDDVIKSAGYRIGPFEVESALLKHPAVSDVGVVGIPDSMRGQIVKAFVVLNPKYSPSDRLRCELQAHCKKVTAPYKYPRQIEFMESLPKTISGKTQRFKLRAKETASL